ncbi:MAG TPA: phosphoribosylformylglycinamidine cyclo-ligase [Candidatus Dormibacteraeota bacterium]|jgi:phosphoribosylformylglycinamidine cyclo-ligase|nr:phosphoribosylformylglycinamidine cyclo-ligase [Candidatus Dormibacteraeota bacterium]
MDPLTYRAAGVDIGAGDEAVRRIAPLAASTHRSEVLGGIGAFAAFCRVPDGYREPVLVSSTDGVGTKLKIAMMADRHDTVGLDLVAMGVNDLLVHGAEPLFFLDYLAVNRVEPDRIEAIVSGIAAGCRQAGCALVGGETAEMGSFYAPGEYDLAGFAVGVAERSGLITGAHVALGDRVLGLASSGLHSNGYTLAREAVFGRMGLQLNDPIPGVGRRVADELLEPTRIYVKPVLALLRDVTVKAMAHITGGGITGNLPRVLPRGRRARLAPAAWPVPAIFTAIQRAAAVDEAEMRRTFNMGLGFLLVVSPGAAAGATRLLEAAGERVYDVGEIVPGDPGVDYV